MSNVSLPRSEIARSLPNASERFTRSISEIFSTSEFTPVVSGAGIAGDCTYTKQTGRFYRQGSFVHLSIEIEWSLHTGSGLIVIDGLPDSAFDSTVLSVASDQLTFTGSLSAVTVPAERQIIIGGSVSGGSFARSALPSSGRLLIGGFYESA